MPNPIRAYLTTLKQHLATGAGDGIGLQRRFKRAAHTCSKDIAT